MNWVQKLKKNKLIVGGIVVGVVIIGLIIKAVGNGNGDHEIVTVEKRDVVDDVRIAGTVEAKIVSDMGFEVSGVVQSVSVTEGQKVYQGQQLAALSLGTLIADLQSAKADVVIKRAEVVNTSLNVEAIKEKHDTLVANAYTQLLSGGLTAEPQSNTYAQVPPTITGRYTGPVGTYKIRITDAGQANENQLYIFDLETGEPVKINKTGPTPLGTRGLFISFSGDADAYRETTWYVTLPNRESDVYDANYSSYQDALRERDRAIDEAEAQNRAQSEGSSIAEAQLAQAEAGVARIQAQIGQRIISAPFAGVVTAVNVDPGESAQTDRSAISLISEGGFGVEVDLPEIDSVKVMVGNTATVIIDALGENNALPARVVSVNRAETLVDGIPIYEARLAFDTEDPRITSGMTADVEIVTDKKEGVLAIPFRALRSRDDGSYFVTVLGADESTQEVEVTIGLRGSDGFTEILAGLSEGDQVLIPLE